jgi:hypothetical protein
MIDGFVLLVPLLLLPILILFRFIGCGGEPFTSGDPRPAPYEDQVTEDSAIVAYWRLGEPAPPAPPDPPAQAKDEVNSNHGDYVETPANQPATELSQGGLSGKAVRGAPNSSLLRSEPSRTSVDFEGGYVRVPNFAAAMQTLTTFGVEAWVLAQGWESGTATAPFAHTVVLMAELDAGPPAVPPRGFSLFAQWVDGSIASDPLPPGNTAGFYWRASVGNGTEFARVTVWDKQAVLNRKTYLAVTYDANKNTDQLRLHVGMGASDAGAWDAFVTTGYVPAQQNRLYIGVGNAMMPPTESIYGPFVGFIQDVAVYSRSLGSEGDLERVATNLELAFGP